MLNYVLSTLRHQKAATAIQVLSLGLGLAMSSFLFVRIAYDHGFDRCFPEADRLQQVWMQFVIAGDERDPQSQCFNAIAPALRDDMGELVEDAFCTRWTNPLFLGDHQLDAFGMTGDSHFLSTLGVEMLQGSAELLDSDPSAIVISDRLAEQYIPAGEDPIGFQFLINGNPVTVRGVYRDYGKETTLAADYISSFYSVSVRWGGGDSWATYARLRPGVTLEEFNNRLKALMDANMPSTETLECRLFARPLTDTHYNSLKNGAYVTLWILAVAILLITALNYVLLALASMSRRAKAIGVHKCNGAGRGRIYSMFILETALVMLGGIAIMVGVYFLAKHYAYEAIYLPIVSHVSMSRLWVIAAVAVLIFLLSACIPAQIFSKIPVSQVFRRFSDGRRWWKQCFLLVEFIAMGLMGGVFVTVIEQYQCLVNAPLGFDPDGVVYVRGYNYSGAGDDRMAPWRFYESLPYVEAVTTSWVVPPVGYSGQWATDEKGDILFSSRLDFWGKNYTDVLHIQMVAGTEPKDYYDVVVNEEWVRRRGWTPENAIGRFPAKHLVENDSVRIVGVMKDFRTNSFYAEQEPLMAMLTEWPQSVLLMRLAEPFDYNMERLQEAVNEAWPQDDIEVKSHKAFVRNLYSEVKLFETMTIVSTIIILFIILIGLVGFVRDEIQRRSREIAIRKVNGASEWDILWLISGDTLKLAVPGVAIGAVLSWLAGRVWLEQFTLVVDHLWVKLAIAAIIVLAVILLCVIVFSYRTAISNPTLSLKSE